MKINLSLVAVAALIAAPSLSSNAEAGTAFAVPKAADTKVAVLDTPAVESIRTIDLKTEPIEPPADQAVAAPADAAVETPAARNETTANAGTPTETKRICRKFSAAIAEIIEVPCE